MRLEWRKLKKRFNNWFIVAFVIILIIPLYGWFFDSKVTLSGVSAVPEAVGINIDTLSDGTYQTYLNNLWENEFPGKKTLLKIRNQLLYSIFRVSPNSNVVIGKNDYLYEPLYILFENQIYAPSSQEYFDVLGNNLNKLKNLLEANGKELYVFITPSKAHFCKEYIPDKYMLLDQEGDYNYTNYSKLIEILDNNNINYYDSVSFIDNNRNSGLLEAPLFYATGIHWSQPWGELCASNFLNYMNEHSKYNLASVTVNEEKSEEPVSPATDLYSSLNLIKQPDDIWWSSNMTLTNEGKDNPTVFMRGGSFMGQSLNALIKNDVFGDDVYFENSYYSQNKYTEYFTISSFTAYDELDLNYLVGKSDILILEVNEGAIYTMSWGFIEYLLEHPQYLDYNLSDETAAITEEWETYNIQINDAVETDENPWGFTAGIIDVDEYGKAVLLNPNTSFTIVDLEDSENVEIEARIHPWVAEYSDGVGIVVWYLDAEGNIVEEQELQMDSEKTTNIFIDMSQHDGVSQIKFLCNNGTNNDDSCDWLIFSSVQH